MGVVEILLTIGLLGLGVAGIAIKILVKPGGEFSGTCASNNPMLRSDDGGAAYAAPVPKTRMSGRKSSLIQGLNRLSGSPLATPTTKSADAACWGSPRNCTRRWNLP